MKRIILFAFLLGIIIGSINNAFAYKTDNLDISHISVLVSCWEKNIPDEQGDGQASRKRKEYPQTEIRKVSWYDQCYGTCSTANGETFDPEAFTTACWSEYPFGTVFVVCRVDGSHCVRTRCNDRGAFRKYGRFLDLSKGAFRELWDLSKGVSKARIEIL